MVRDLLRRAAAVAALACALPALAAEPLRFEVDPAWPRPLPNDWIMGQASGVAVDAQDNVWVVQRPRTLTDDEKAASLDRPAPAAASRRRRCWSSIRPAR